LTASARPLRVNAAVSSYLAVNENFNAGWRAVIGGRQLQAVRLDGWKQAWLLPAGTEGLVRLTYQPQSLYRVVVVGGLAGLGLIALVAVWPWALPRPRRRRRLRRRSSDEPPGEAPGEVPGEAPGEGRRFLVRVAGPAAVLAGLAAAGLWLGGYPGALILPAATVGFLICGSDLADGAAGRLLPEAVRPRALAGLLIAASVCGAVGDDLSRAGASGLSVTAAQDAIPQVICLVVVARLTAALILS
jgi:arabinofuranan 3-O-arabinosyltransferase